MTHMTVAAAGLLVAFSACIETDVPLTKSSKTTIIEGDAVLNAAHATLFGGLVNPINVSKKEDAAELSSAVMTSLTLEVVPDAVEGPADRDDLLFVLTVDVYVRSKAPDTKLQQVLVGWYDGASTDQAEPTVIDMEVDDSIDILPYLKEGCTFTMEGSYVVPPDDVAVKAFAEMVGKYDVL